MVSKTTYVYCEKMDNKEFRVLMKHCFLAKKNTFEAKAWFDKHYLNSAPRKSTVEKWFAKFE
jgi:sarcosine oxidase delta subunit